MAEIYDWDIVAANNNSAPPDGAPENMNYQEVNDTMREMMAVVARFVTAIRGATTTAGSSNAYTLVSGLTIGAYEAGQIFSFIADRTSTGSVTLNVDGLGAGNLVDSTGVQCGSGDIKSGSVYAVVRRASDFQLLGTFTRSGILALSQITFNKAYTTGGSSNAYTVTTGFSLTALTTGAVFALIPDRANTGAATLNVDGIGAVAWEDDESLALAANDIQAGVPVIVVYNGTEFRTLCGIPINLATFVSGTLPAANGGTGQTSLANALDALLDTLSSVTIAADDEIVIRDTSDSGNPKKAAASGVGAGKQTIWIPAVAMYKANAAAGPSAIELEVTNALFHGLAFDPTSAENVWFHVSMPKGWNAGNISFRAHWAHPATDTDFGVVWTLFGAAFGDNEAFTGAALAGAAVTDTGGTTSNCYISAESSGFAIGSSPAKGNGVNFLFQRSASNGSDTMAVDAYLIGIEIFYTTDANTDA